MIGLILLTAGAYALIRGRTSVRTPNEAKNKSKSHKQKKSSSLDNDKPEGSKE